MKSADKGAISFAVMSIVVTAMFYVTKIGV